MSVQEICIFICSPRKKKDKQKYKPHTHNIFSYLNIYKKIFIIYNNRTPKKKICFVRALVEFYGEKFNGKYNSKHVKCICSFLMLYLCFKVQKKKENVFSTISSSYNIGMGFCRMCVLCLIKCEQYTCFFVSKYYIMYASICMYKRLL